MLEFQHQYARILARRKRDAWLTFLPVGYNLIAGNARSARERWRRPLTHALLAGSPGIDAGDPTTVTGGGSSLAYDATTQQYSYVWKTDKSWAGTCRVLTLTFTDGTTRSASFRFTR